MARAAGILTSRGGLASHAAVVARGWGIPAVVGAAADRGPRRPGRSSATGPWPAGDVITIDGSTGEVFEGTVPGTTEVVPEAQTLLAWAKELGIPIGDDAARATTRRPQRSAVSRRPGRREPRRRLPSGASRSRASPRFRASPTPSCRRRTVVQPILDQLALDGLVATVAGAYRLTESGTSRAASLRAAEQASVGRRSRPMPRSTHSSPSTSG